MEINKLNFSESENGQSTIEFLISFVFVLGFLFLFLRLSIVYTNGYLMHYATFSASRAYMVADNGDKNAEGSDGLAFTKAKAVFDKIVNTTQIFGQTIQLKENSMDSENMNSLLVGVFADLNEYFMVPGVTNSRKDLNLKSESFLGREPTRGECIQSVCEVIKGITSVSCSAMVTLDDNGC
ncbi:MAG: hypothetical protein COW00_06610 [Bdellovibrio sp. CG12_big_fil_rev_8_21_14_0_65_39_13]|nr:MAG: hypothetical protein COW78_19145 [Bdellovibrio sp. CG22_combo_CG10-13_8_21_14_all_39_27]PIQ60891.1 MAG: hypothetical protein COW00_06610 [Bdellovibrio sp. CG12_big_fil_rev_8_21_14_0_65_39_13]PIR36516.1 MAG: hypothetical protein COV37_03955 [Bdellovibrio sp. CG11_big_fil_rev_8_21_14_0_20_39_38]